MLQPHVVGLRHRSLHAQLGAADRHVLQLAPVRLAVDDQRDVFLVGQDEAQRTAALEIPQVLRSNRGRHRSSSSGYSRSEEHTSELQSLMRISYAVFCLKKKIKTTHQKQT